MKSCEILEMKELENTQSYLESKASIFLVSFSPRDYGYSPVSIAYSGLINIKISIIGRRIQYVKIRQKYCKRRKLLYLKELQEINIKSTYCEHK